MSAAAESPRSAVEVIRFRTRTLDEIANEEIRYCDACGEEAIFGCVVGVRLGFSSYELCASCWVALREAVK